MFLNDVISAIAREWQQEGPRATLDLCLEPFFARRKVYVMRRSLKAPIRIPALDQGITIRQSTLADRALWETLVPAYRAKRFEKKMQAGEVCFIATRGEKAVGMFWAAFADSPSVKPIHLKIGPREVYLWGAYVLPAYRSRGVMTAIALHLNHWLKDHGYEKTVQLTDQSNKPAIKFALKAGNQATAQYTLLKILGWRHYQYSAVKLHLLPGPNRGELKAWIQRRRFIRKIATRRRLLP